MSRFIALGALFILVFLVAPVRTMIKCEIGWGQRGLNRNEGISWPRTCASGYYCFEAVTEDIEIMRKLIDFPWDTYYNQYYVKGCGGTFGTPGNFHPFKGKPKYFRTTPLFIKINITTPMSVTGTGGTELLSLNYHCRRDMCSGAFQWKSVSMAIVATVVSLAYMLALN